MSKDDKPRAAGVKAPQTLEDFMAQALAMEREAVERYTDFTLQAVFVSRPEERAVFAQIFRLFWRDPRYLDHMMSLLLPQISGGQEDRPALAAEKRAEAFFAELARVATSEPVRNAALELRAEEAEHVELVQAWLAKVPKPDQDWAEDPDPPRYTD